MSYIPMPAPTSVNLKLKEGELVCDKCEGKGGNAYNHPSDDLTKPEWVRCQKCQGTGKVDWIENIVGKKPPEMFGSSSTSGSSGGTFAKMQSDVDNAFNIPQHIIDSAAQRLAGEIDKEILETIRSDLEQNHNKMKTAAAIMSEMGGTVFDNRIISKFMLFFATKPEVKAKENRSTISRCY